MLESMVVGLPRIIADREPGDDELLHNLARRNLTHYPSIELAYLLAAALIRLNAAWPA